MPDRKPIVGGNWKMNLHSSQAQALVAELIEKIPSTEAVDVVICPASAYLQQVSEQLSQADSTIQLGAQNAYHADEGAFTGEISMAMVKDAGATAVILGHSERRHVIGETDVQINAKVRAALAHGLQVILCVGETLEQREAGQTDAINAGQLNYGLAGVSAEQMQDIVVAYEPVWAIGTGKTATPEDAQAAHAAIRAQLAHIYDERVAEAVRLQYGGSCKPGNAAELFAQPDIDGGLIGGASLKAEDFAAIVNAAG